ncbi:S1 family peptidase [Georgenia sp. TF02-10]|uniref:S1 family peptidase n=1 Tax=Georgenia sp. TF02-10 TaxID=2917725 RepID=UPI001FA7C013|nr:S1 family peptidase [Georgenia sp. TF02-10]UNX54662.1 S1 family peptidase [Georgenia sp. TF02-10]
MDLDEARETKNRLARTAAERAGTFAQASGRPRPPVALGLVPGADGGYGIAVRYRTPTGEALAHQVADEVGEAADVRWTGRVRALQVGAGSGGVGPGGAGPGGPGPGGAGPGTPDPGGVPDAVGETGRVRPLRPGVSVAHVAVSAGTLGAFVRVDGALHALSNYHVLVGSPSAAIGDPVLQPGPADGGQDPADRIGTLAGFVPLQPGADGLVDAAVAALADEAVDLDYPVGRVTTTAAVVGAEEVAKVGRTTGLTHGRVTAIELDDVVVEYGEDLGELRFDDQIEVQSVGAGPFSRGGDSGSLVYRADGVAVGLLFAGSETGGDNGTGLTYLNPIGTVLDALAAELAR